ncbi:hypothetical protein GCM10022416_50410 [Actinomadura keratinilytica]|uniref:Uncharacterized protein n=1 Tax=Actinomadura keratinilytica TaxID=547461 RepID=A0ABP7ZB68_9ACTN
MPFELRVPLPGPVRWIMVGPQQCGDQGGPDLVAVSAGWPHRRRAGAAIPARPHMTAVKPQTRSTQRTTRSAPHPFSKAGCQDPPDMAYGSRGVRRLCGSTGASGPGRRVGDGGTPPTSQRHQPAQETTRQRHPPR